MESALPVTPAPAVLTLTKHPREDQALHQYSYDPAVIDQAVMLGDMRKMDDRMRLAFYRAVCLSVGLNPLTQPFTPLERQDKTVWLYANSSCTQQLAKLYQVSFRDIVREQVTILGEPFYSVRVVAVTPDGRAVPSHSLVALSKKKKIEKGRWPSGDPKFVDALDADGEPLLTPLRGEALANAIMRADTKALRRATLALVGLGWMQSDYEGRGVTLNLQTGELLEEARTAPSPRRLDTPAEQGKTLAQHIGDLCGEAPAPPLHPLWTQIAEWYTMAGRAEHYAHYQQWACRRYGVASIAEIPDEALGEMAAKVYATLEPLIVARQAPQGGRSAAQAREDEGEEGDEAPSEPGPSWREPEASALWDDEAAREQEEAR